MTRKSVIAVVLCVSLLSSILMPAVVAADVFVPVDVGDLFNPDSGLPDGGDTGSGDTGSGDAGDNTGGDTGDNTGDGTTIIPGDSDNTGSDNTGSGNTGSGNGSTQVVPSKKDKDDDKTTVLPTPDTGKTETPKEDAKEEVKVEKVSFSDVKDEDWFCNDVGTLAGMGIINGYPDGSFLPDNNVTRAEFLKLLITLIAGDNTFTTYDKVFEDVEVDAWYSKYITTAFVFGIIDVNDYGTKFGPDEPITRREVAKLVSNSVDMQVGGYKTPFVDTADHNIIALYRYAIMQGTVDPATGYRFFYPDTQITRAETAAVILRLYRSVEEGDKYVQQFMKDNNMPPLQALYTPVTKNDFYNELTNAWDKNQAFVMYNYSFSTGSESMRAVKENLYKGYCLAGMTHPELATGISMNAIVSCDGEESVLEVRFDSEEEYDSFDTLMNEKLGASKKADYIVSQLFDGTENGKIKADAIHDYVVDNLEYDYSFEDDSYTAYGAFTSNKAVCQGYSAVFNLLCKAAGVKSLAVANDEHMWNAVLVGGEILFYDTTYDDTGADSEKYKGVSRNVLREGGLHKNYIMPDVEYFI